MAKEFQVTMVDDVAVVGEGVGFERIRRITGYLVGTLDRFNNGKRAEEGDRVKHDVSCCAMTDERTDSRSA